MINLVRQSQTTDGRTHDTLDNAVAHERHLKIVEMRIQHRAATHADLGEIDKLARHLQSTYPAMVGLMSEDLRAGVHAASPPVVPETSAPWSTPDGDYLKIGDMVELVTESAMTDKWFGDARKRVINIEGGGQWVALEGDTLYWRYTRSLAKVGESVITQDETILTMPRREAAGAGQPVVGSAPDATPARFSMVGN
jgi:hypothetical protein